MLASSFFALSLFVAGTSAAPVPFRREVPQEHSHEAILQATNVALKTNNPSSIQDAVFGLLGSAAAQTGIGSFAAGPDCLQSGTADQAFSNAKAANDVAGMVAALQYKALERNTAGVGVKSVICTDFTPVNPEIAAITQHQDPASDGAAATNKAIVLELAKQIKAVGGDPQLALKTGTFAPGDKADNTGAGLSCDDITPEGCIFTKNLIVEDATAAEIDAAVGGAGNAAVAAPAAATTTAAKKTKKTKGGKKGNAAAAAASCPAVATVTVTAGAAEATAAVVAAPVVAAASGNLQAFTGSLGGISAPAVTTGGRGFEVEGNASFDNIKSALVRSCDVQNNKCKDAANGGADVAFDDCTAQQTQCEAAGADAAVTAAADAVATAAPAAATTAAAIATPVVAAASGANTAVKSTSTAKFGTCTNAGVEFAAGLNGRKADEFTFQPANLADFAHGEALNPQIIYEFICDTFVNKCGGAASNVASCKALAATITTRDTSAADTWNAGIEKLAF